MCCVYNLNPLDDTVMVSYATRLPAVSWRAQWLYICCQDIISVSCLHGYWSTYCYSCYFCSIRDEIQKKKKKNRQKVQMETFFKKSQYGKQKYTFNFVVNNFIWRASLRHLLSHPQVLETSLHTQKVGGSFASSMPCSEYLCSASSWLVWAISWEAYSAKELAEWRKCLWWVKKNMR